MKLIEQRPFRLSIGSRIAARGSIRYGVAASSVMALGVVAWVVFGLFKPVITWTSGWQPLPTAPPVERSAINHFTAPEWRGISELADSILNDARVQLQAPALSAAISVDGEPVWASAIGIGDVDTADPVVLTSRFRIGSSSKTINAIAMARLMDAGKLDIDRSVRDYLPDLPPSYQGIHTRHAISHTAGIPDYGLCLCFPVWEHKNQRHFAGVRDALQVFKDRALLFAPGQDFRYSSYSTNVAGAVVEVASGMPYLDWLRKGVFEPLKMAHSLGDIAGEAVAQRVQFYEVADGQYKLADTVDNSIRYPSGGLLSTPLDMLAVGSVLVAGDFLSDATRSQLLTRQRIGASRENPQSYALGIRVFDDKAMLNDTIRTRFYSHHGAAVGSTSYFGIYPQYGLVISVMMNKGQDNLDALAPHANRLVELFLVDKLRRDGTARPLVPARS